MTIAVACEHRGYETKRKLIPLLTKLGHQVEDFGCQSTASVDYPDFAIPAARAVAAGKCQLGVLLDGNGIGMTVAANKVRGIRAALANDEISARRAREHNHCNVLCIGTDLLGGEQIHHIVEAFLNASHAEGRHARRVEKLNKFEREAFH